MKAKELKALRRRLGDTQAELAERLGVHAVSVARWEVGMRKIAEPTARLLRLLAAQPPALKHGGHD